jgi:hypothetical protein
VFRELGYFRGRFNLPYEARSDPATRLAEAEPVLPNVARCLWWSVPLRDATLQTPRAHPAAVATLPPCLRARCVKRERSTPAVLAPKPNE